MTLLIFLLAIFALPLSAQEFISLVDNDRRDLLHEVLSGEVAKDHVIEITRHHRIQGARGYRSSAQYVVEQLRAYGFSESEAFIESYPSDGHIVYQTWQSPSGWDIESAELRIVEPFDERIVGFPEIAMSVVTYSNPGDVTADLVFVGAGTSDADYQGKDVRGKFVLATGYGGAVHRMAVLKYGAAAVVVYLDDERAAEYPDMLAYTGMWPRSEELDGVTFGFNLTNRQGERLRSLLDSGERVVLSGNVRGIGLEPYYLDVVVADVRGSEFPEEVIVFSAHLDHPKESANDNASGSAALIDIARSINELIDSGRIERPKRTLRFLWVPEWYGTMAYLDAHPEVAGPALGGGWLANLNMDMVGENLEILHSALVLTKTPASIPSALNDVMANLAETVSNVDIRTPRGSMSLMNYRHTPYSGGSDHMMFIDRKIPGVMFSHSPDYTHHTSEDTPDKVDPVELERSELIAAMAALYLSDLTEEEAIDLVLLVSANGQARLGAAGRRARVRVLDGVFPSWYDALNVVDHALQWEVEAVSSVLTFNDAPLVREAVGVAMQRLVQVRESLLQEIRVGLDGAAVEEAQAPLEDTRIPVRITRGPLDFGLPESALAPEDLEWYSSSDFPLDGNMRFELVNFIDGSRSVTEIRNALSAEFLPVPVEAVGRYLDDLVAVGALAWRD
ncbi:MAG: DUF4910 domain-containing protein [Gemmatimonadota bacterium]|nr:DUF4910 domain-containing protein [Gemmatimonadota bacterium]